MKNHDEEEPLKKCLKDCRENLIFFILQSNFGVVDSLYRRFIGMYYYISIYRVENRKLCYTRAHSED